MTDVLGSVVIARNGDRYEYYQDPKTYEPAFTESTPLGAVSMASVSVRRILTMFALILSGPVSRPWVLPSLGLSDRLLAFLHQRHKIRTHRQSPD